jgi:hypothetical protein
MATVKQPKWKRATGTEGAISVKGGAYPVRKGKGVMGKGGYRKGEVSQANAHIKRLQLQKTKQTSAIKIRNQKIVKLEAKLDQAARGVMLKNVRKARSPIKIPTSAKVAGGAVAGALAEKYISKKKKGPR